MKCQERAGFLIPRPCPTEATVQCSQCRKWVCGNHTASLTHGGLGCTSCAAANNVGPGAQARQIRDYYGYHPGVFSGWGRGWGGHSIGYTTGDYEVFQSGYPQGTDVEPIEDLTGS